MFRSFLRSPRVTKKNKVWEELTTDEARASTAGPLRLYHIKEKASVIEKRLAILKYTKSYDKEDSLVVLFDYKGAFIGYYRFSSEQFYEDYVTRDVVSGGDHLGTRSRVFNSGSINTSMPKMTLLYTDEDKWTDLRQAQTDYMWNEGWRGLVARKLLPVHHVMCLYLCASYCGCNPTMSNPYYDMFKSTCYVVQFICWIFISRGSFVCSNACSLV